VETSAGPFTAGRLLVTAGAWAGQLLDGLDLRLEVRRKAVMWHATSDDRTRVEAGFPCYLFEQAPGHPEVRRGVRPDPSADLGVTTSVLYGFPALDGRGLKAAEHSGGEAVADPLVVDRRLHDADRAPVEAFLKRHIPSAETPCREFSVCLYTMSPDEHFIVDRHPEHERVVFAAGLSGHGYKFTPVLGAALADLTVDGATNLPIEFLSLGRFA
jgi:glycine/D-amino acid oxidase-like deaminating enzyme